MSLRVRKNTINYSDTKRIKRKKNVEKVTKEVQQILIEHGLSDDEAINEINQSAASLNLHLEVEKEPENKDDDDVEKETENGDDDEHGDVEDDASLQCSQAPSFPDLNNNAFKYISKQLPFKKVHSFESEAKYDEYMRTQFPFVKCKKSHKQGCAECAKRKTGHQMRIKRLSCECNNSSCELEFINVTSLKIMSRI